jgi:hypothetical protein
LSSDHTDIDVAFYIANGGSAIAYLVIADVEIWFDTPVVGGTGWLSVRTGNYTGQEVKSREERVGR